MAAAILGALALAGACAHSTRAAAPRGAAADSTAPPVGPIPVQVENRSAYDIILYAVRGTQRRRIGSVGGVSRTTVTIPATFTADRGAFAVAAVRLAGRESYLSEAVVPQPGIQLVLTIEPRVVNSVLSVQ